MHRDASRPHRLPLPLGGEAGARYVAAGGYSAVLSGSPAQALRADLKANRPDLVIMTSHGHTGFIRWALGSVTDRVIRRPRPRARPATPGGGRRAALAPDGKVGRVGITLLAGPGWPSIARRAEPFTRLRCKASSVSGDHWLWIPRLIAPTIATSGRLRACLGPRLMLTRHQPKEDAAWSTAELQPIGAQKGHVQP